MPEDTIWVIPGPAAEGTKVGLWDRDKAHPGGEAYVANDTDGDPDKKPRPVEVGQTGIVQQALADGRIVRVSGPQSTKPIEPPAAPSGPK